MSIQGVSKLLNGVRYSHADAAFYEAVRTDTKVTRNAPARARPLLTQQDASAFSTLSSDILVTNKPKGIIESPLRNGNPGMSNAESFTTKYTYILAKESDPMSKPVDFVFYAVEDVRRQTGSPTGVWN
jgi:hypothetical protein